MACTIIFRTVFIFFIYTITTNVNCIQQRDNNEGIFTLPVFLNDPRPITPESLVFTTRAVPSDEIYYIVKFEPKVTMEVVHHMIVSSCEKTTLNRNGYSICEQPVIMFAWAKNASGLELPADVGFKVGKGTDRLFVEIEVHFAYVTEIDDDTASHIGVVLSLTHKSKSKTAEVMVLETDFNKVEPGTRTFFEIACVVPANVTMHIFAFRPHTHTLGKVVSGYVVTKDNEGKNKWTLIGKKNPLEPQMFYPAVNSTIVAYPGDILASRCTMQNDLNHTVQIGATSKDEMCIFYVMFWIDKESRKFIDSCSESSKAFYSWENDNRLNNIPQDASILQYVM